MGSGMVTQAVYVCAVVRLPWWRYGGRLSSWRRILSEGWAPSGVAAETVALSVCLVGAVVLLAAYVLGWRSVRSGTISPGLVWGGALVFSATLFWLQPITADLFVYLSQAHLLTDLGANPLRQAPADFADPLLAAYRIEYTRHPSVYGPAWVLLTAGGTVGRLDLWTGLAFLKGLALAGYLACCRLIMLILRRMRSSAATEGLYLFAWNPLVLLMAVGDGHNDIVAMALVLTAIWWSLDARWVPATGALVLSFWVKYVTAVLIPPLFMLVLRAGARDHRPAPGGGEQPSAWRFVLSCAVVGLGVSGLVLAPFGAPDWALDAARRLLVPANWRSGTSTAGAAGFVVGAMLFSAAYMALIARLWRARGALEPMLDAAFLAALLALFLGAARSQPWHLVWPAALAGLTHRRWAWPAVAALSAALLLFQVWVEWGAPGLTSL